MESIKYIFLSLTIIFSVSLLKAQDIDSLKFEFPRVLQAAQNTQPVLEKLAADQDLVLPLQNIFLRAFKDEKILEVWGNNADEWKLIKRYPVCTIPGKPGPKIRQGDKQVPEGWYRIDSINPNSSFHLSLRINYPNAADSVRSRNEKDPGGDIFIHGDCYSVGCLPIQDEPMEEVFWLVVQSLYAFPHCEIPVLILPFDLNNEEKYAQYTKDFPQNIPLWEELKSIQLYFEEFGLLPDVLVSEEGQYLIQY